MTRKNTELQRRDKKAAIVGVVFFAALQLCCAVCFGSLCFIPDAPMLLVVMMAVFAAVCLLLIIPALVVMKKRFEEIEGGELDAASEY